MRTEINAVPKEGVVQDGIHTDAPTETVGENQVKFDLPLGYSNIPAEVSIEKKDLLNEIVDSYNIYFHVAMTSKDTVRITLYFGRKGLPGPLSQEYEGPLRSTHHLLSGKGRLHIHTIPKLSSETITVLFEKSGEK